MFKVVDIVEVTHPMLENGDGSVLEENVLLKGEHVVSVYYLLFVYVYLVNYHFLLYRKIRKENVTMFKL